MTAVPTKVCDENVRLTRWVQVEPRPVSESVRAFERRMCVLMRRFERASVERERFDRAPLRTLNRARGTRALHEKDGSSISTFLSVFCM